MSKIIAAFNTTVDGFCDHTGFLPDAEIHRHYKELLDGAAAILYGRTTYQLMQFWQDLLKNPSGEQTMDEFASAMDRVPKIVFSNTLKNTGWDSARLSDEPLERMVPQLKKQKGKDFYIGSRSLIVQLTNLRMIDEYQLCIHPVILGKGLPLFEKLKERTHLKLIKTNTLRSGAVIHYYEPADTVGFTKYN